MNKWPTHQLFRAFHIVVCLCVMLPLLLHPSALHHMLFKAENVIHGAVYLIFYATALVAYFIVGYSDPGYLTHDKARLFRHRRGYMSDRLQSEDGPNVDALTNFNAPQSTVITVCSQDSDMNELDHTEADPTDTFRTFKSHGWHQLLRISRWLVYQFTMCGSKDAYDEPVFNLSVPVRFCDRCHLEQPLRCRHCPDCQRCVMKFDHHCPWIGNCVGERNHSCFVVFIVLQDFVLWWTLYLAASSIEPYYLWSDWFRANGLFFAEILVLTLIGIPLTGLLGFHTYLALANRTTWETVSYERIIYLRHLDDRLNPFNQGCAKNCYSFCCSPFPFGWDRIYAETVGSHSASCDRDPVVSPSVLKIAPPLSSCECSVNPSPDAYPTVPDSFPHSTLHPHDNCHLVPPEVVSNPVPHMSVAPSPARSIVVPTERQLL